MKQRNAEIEQTATLLSLDLTKEINYMAEHFSSTPEFIQALEYLLRMEEYCQQAGFVDKKEMYQIFSAAVEQLQLRKKSDQKLVTSQ